MSEKSIFKTLIDAQKKPEIFKLFLSFLENGFLENLNITTCLVLQLFWFNLQLNLTIK